MSETPRPESPNTSSTPNPAPPEREEGLDFVRALVAEAVAQGKNGGQVVTRFPPEPNGYLHIGHAKAICLNFGIAKEFAGRCHLRFDDTNPTKEDVEFTDSIIEDVRWLGFDWGEHLYYASDYFEQLYQWALALIDKGLAYVCDLDAEQVRAYRGTLTEPGKESPFRSRSIAENRDLFQRMRAGEFPDGTRTLRAKIDMASSNLNMRDPALYRIRRAHHHRTGDAWCIYPMYDWAHGQSDAIEGITHSICTLEFENHRPLYDWFIEKLELKNHPRQVEFARLNLGYTVMSKRKLLQLVQEKRVSGWDDPRMPTIAGLRRRGYTPSSLRAFAERIGVAKRESMVDVGLLENAIADELNASAPRVMGVLKPLKVVIENWPEGQVEWIDAPYLPPAPGQAPAEGPGPTRKVPFGRELYIERDDFMEDPPKKFFRLGPGREVRLRWGWFLKCERFIKNEAGEVMELRCTYDPATKGGNSPDGRKVKGTIHWVSAAHALDAEVRLYDRLFNVEDPAAVEDWLAAINPESLVRLSGCKLEPSVATLKQGERVQFERQGYFCLDAKESRPEALVFNRIVTLKSSWAKAQAKDAGGAEAG